MSLIKKYYSNLDETIIVREAIRLGFPNWVFKYIFFFKRVKPSINQIEEWLKTKDDISFEIEYTKYHTVYEQLYLTPILHVFKDGVKLGTMPIGKRKYNDSRLYSLMRCLDILDNRIFYTTKL